MKKYKYINVYDSITGSDPFVNDENIQVHSVSDMVRKVLDVTEGYGNRLIISGDGGFNYQSVGAMNHTDFAGDLSLQLDDPAMLTLKGGAGIWFPLLRDRISHVYLTGLDDVDEDSSMLCLAVGKALGTGTRVIAQESLFIWYNSERPPARRRTYSAQMDRGALRNRLAELSGG